MLAPTEIALWAVTFHHPPRPLMVRNVYTDSLTRHLGSREREHRFRLAMLVDGRRLQPPLPLEPLLAAIPRYDLAGICLQRGLTWSRDPAPALARRGFERVYRGGTIKAPNCRDTGGISRFGHAELAEKIRSGRGLTLATGC